MVGGEPAGGGQQGGVPDPAVVDAGDQGAVVARGCTAAMRPLSGLAEAEPCSPGSMAVPDQLGPGPRVVRVGIAAHIARLRAVVGHELLLLPAVSVLPVDDAGRVLLVRHAGHDDEWGVLGGGVDVGESPADAAIREAREEIGVSVRLVRLLDVLGGPDYEVRYPNGDRTAYVTAVYEARIIEGFPAVCDGELTDFGWFAPGELPRLRLSRFARALLRATGRF